MASFFTDFFRTQLAASQTIMDSAQIKLVLFRQAPAMSNLNPAWTAARTVAELKASSPGWTEVSGISGYPLTLALPVSTRIPAGTSSKYVMISEYPFTTLGDTAEVQAIGVVRVGTLGGQTDPLIFVTNTPIDGRITNVAPVDALTASPDISFPDATNRWIFNWATAAPDPIEGPLAFKRGAPEFELSGTQHVWLYPQRVNMIANPSFEAGIGFWSSSGTLTRVSGGAPGGGAWAGSTTASGGFVKLESNVFSTVMGEQSSEEWTVQLMAKGTGTLKVGLVYWDGDYSMTTTDWGTDESWDLVPGAWVHAATHRHAPEAVAAMVRIEVQGATAPLAIDQVLAERGYLKEWAYFDGDEHYGMRDDFSWYGGTNRHGASYSLWYNHRKAVIGRLFARMVDPNDPSQNVTDDDMEEQGLVYRWVPAGVTVVPHLDVFYPYDQQNPVPPKPAGVMAYATPGTADGVRNPWV